MRLAATGHRLALGSRDKSGCEATAKAAAEVGAEAMAVALDVGDPDSVKCAIDEIMERFGRVDHLVNNAGITRDNLLVRLREEDWDSVLKTDLTGVFLCTKAVLKSMIRQRYGRVISISSVVGLRGNKGQSNYAAAKAGVHGFTRALAREVASRGITVNAVAPGYIDTEMTRDLPDQAKERLLESIPLGRFGTGQDVAGVVGFLVSKEAGYLTGQVLCVDGGMTA